MAKRNFKKSRIFFNRKYLMSVIVAVLLITSGVFAFSKLTDDKPPVTKTDTTSTDSRTKLNLNPATKEEKNAARDKPTEVQQNSNTDSSKTQVTPIITNADTQETRAYVPGIIEEGGTCTATYTHGADVITATSSGSSNVNHTICGAMTLSGPVNISGTWSVTVSYSSSTSAGKSQPSTFKVP